MEESADAGGRPPLGTLPVLVYDHGLTKPTNRHTAFAIGDQSLHTSVVPELAANYYHVTPQGWVFLVAFGPSPRTSLWDPRTGESITLPAMERDLPEDWECYLSDAPTAPSCVVLVLDIKNPNFLYCRAGDSQWSAHEYDVGDVEMPFAPPSKIVIQQAAAAGGKFYFQETGKLGVIDFSQATPEFSFIDCLHPEFPEGSNCGSETLVGSGGELFSVYICLKGFTPEILTVCVYRIDLSGEALSKVDDLGDRVLLLSYHNSQLLCSASKYGVMGDKDGGLLCIYNLDDQSLENVRPCPEMTELLRSPFWMLPTDRKKILCGGAAPRSLCDTA